MEITDIVVEDWEELKRIENRFKGTIRKAIDLALEVGDLVDGYNLLHHKLIEIAYIEKGIEVVAEELSEETIENIRLTFINKERPKEFSFEKELIFAKFLIDPSSKNKDDVIASLK